MNCSKVSARSIVSVLGMALIGASSVFAGPLDPPPGPVTPSYKTLTEVEPRIAINATNTRGDGDCVYVISEPGSYYLTENLIGVESMSGIKITASGVTVDLKGFTLEGVSGSTQGVVVTGTGLRNIVITNGSASGWGLSAIDTFAATHCRVEAIRASSNGGAGLRIGSQTLVRDCVASLNAGTGISTQSSCVVENCISSANLPGGISTQSNCVVDGCTVEGITSGAGIDVFTGSTVTRCSASGNLNGIQTSGDCTITNCTARGNSNTGISAGIGCTVTACTVGNNTGDGIRVSIGSHVLNNICRSNGLAAGNGAGIHATGGANRIEGNNCTGADRGIDVDVAGNFISRNTCSGNFTNNWDVVAGNICVVVQGAPAGAILGNTGGVAPGSTDPNANFTY